MDYELLAVNAETAIEEIKLFIAEDGSSDTLESILAQMVFIRDLSKKGKNPITELGPNREFTYGILSSREFASPKELKLKEYINKVDSILYNE